MKIYVIVTTQIIIVNQFADLSTYDHETFIEDGELCFSERSEAENEVKRITKLHPPSYSFAIKELILKQ